MLILLLFIFNKYDFCSWATPHQAWKITNHERGTTKVSTEYALNSYERNIQVKSTRLIYTIMNINWQVALFFHPFYHT